MNDVLQQGILNLLYSAVTGKAMPLPEGFDLAQAMPLIKSHQIGNLVYYGAANCGIDTKLPVMQDLFAITYKCMITDERQRKELKRLMDAFDANGIHYMPVKGVLMKPLYPKTDMRIMGELAGSLVYFAREYVNKKSAPTKVDARKMHNSVCCDTNLDTLCKYAKIEHAFLLNE